MTARVAHAPRTARGEHNGIDAMIAEMIWVGAHRMSDSRAAERMGVTPRTVQRWRARMREIEAAGQPLPRLTW